MLGYVLAASGGSAPTPHELARCDCGNRNPTLFSSAAERHLLLKCDVCKSATSVHVTAGNVIDNQITAMD